MTAFYVRARREREGAPLELLYVAMANTPEHAVELVSALVSPSTELRATGETLSGRAAAAIRLQPGRAKLM